LPSVGKLSHICVNVCIHFSVEITYSVFYFSIYLVHDELKDKQFELELSWVGADTKGVFERVPQSVFQEAEKSAKAAMEAESDSDTEDM
jgi:hypothetical protein